MTQEEKRHWKKGYKYIAGIDEAGRGPLAGPVSAGAVLILEKDFKEVKKILKEGGILSFCLTSSESYISNALGEFLLSL